MSSKIKISIIIPYYKGESFYPALLNSIKKSLDVCQYYNFNYEVITVIDSMETTYESVVKIALSTFHTLDNVEVVVKKNKRNIGVAKSRNFALSIANGAYLHIIDQDDLVSPTFYIKAIPLFDQYNFILMNGLARYTVKKYNSHRLYYFTPSLTIKGLLTEDFIRSPGQVVFAKLLCKKVSFPEPKSYMGADDRFFWINLLIENEGTIKTTYVNSPEYIANIHESNYSIDGINLKRSALEGWGLIDNTSTFRKYHKLISNDKIRLKYGLKDELSLSEKIYGFWFNLKYFMTPNKLIRFLIKRK